MAGGSDAAEAVTLTCARCGKPSHLQDFQPKIASNHVELGYGLISRQQKCQVKATTAFGSAVNIFLENHLCPKCMELKLPREGAAFWSGIDSSILEN
ncbi:hypothetical protein SDJN02_09860 [Cucurbita argyrosperma subsp. argyrosperma]|nr:hypothetical protein SDJN02_09860 [Cucurbita argyrosperma subsp. argyrosperma]